MKEQILYLLQKLNSVYDGKLIETDIYQYTQKIIDKATIVSVTSKGELKAFIAYYDNDFANKVAFLTMIAVDPNEQGKGYGKRLMNFCIDSLKKNNFKALALEVLLDNVNAIKLYESLDFRKLENSQLNKIYMQKEL